LIDYTSFVFTGDFFPPELDFTQFFEAQEKYSFCEDNTPPMPPELNIVTSNLKVETL